MKKFCFNFFLLVFLIFLVGCSSLHKTQTRSVHYYYEMMNDYHKYPEILGKNLAESKTNNRHLYPGTYTDKIEMIDNLILSLEEFENSDDLDEKSKQKLDALESHVNKYFLIIPNGLKILKFLEGTSVVVGNFFGVGRYVSSAFSNVREMKITPKKAESLKNHLKNGEQITKDAIAELNQYLENLIQKEIVQEKENLKSSYVLFLNALREKTDSYEYYSKYNTIFVQNFKKLHYTERLAKLLLETNQLILESQKELLDKTNHRKKLSQELESNQKLYLKINEIKNIIKKLEEL